MSDDTLDGALENILARMAAGESLTLQANGALEFATLGGELVPVAHVKTLITTKKILCLRSQHLNGAMQFHFTRT